MLQIGCLVSAIPEMLFLNIPGKANRVSGLGEKEIAICVVLLSSGLVPLDGRQKITIFWVSPSLALLQAPRPRHTQHTHIHAHTPPHHTSESGFLCTGKTHLSGSGLGWPHPLLGSRCPASLSSLAPFTKSSSGPWRTLTFVLCGHWVQCQPHSLLFGFS